MLVEDDVHAGVLIQDLLESEGFEVRLCRSGESALRIFDVKTYDLCILDCMLPGQDGFTVARTIKSHRKDFPFIFLTAKSLKEDVLKGFELGADDYITKPFEPKELVLRIKAILRRSRLQIFEDGEEVVTLGKYTFDYKNQGLNFKGQLQRMTKRESEVLRLLVSRPNQIVAKDAILMSSWGSSDYFTGRSLDVYIAKLRKYLSQDPTIKIENIYGVGFILKCDASSEKRVADQ